MYDPNLNPQAIAELCRQLGHAYIIALSHIKSMCDLPKMKDDTPSISHFVSELNGSVGALSVTIEKTLGIYWNSEKDYFIFKLSPDLNARTKRHILSVTSSIYDPLGFLSPVTLLAKILMQPIWRENFAWDECRIQF